MTPDELREIKQRANAAELPNGRTVNRLKANLRECLAEIAALEERCHSLEEQFDTICADGQAKAKRIAELEAEVARANSVMAEKVRDMASLLLTDKDAELERLKTCLARLLASHQQCWADGGTSMKWEDVPVVKEARANLKEKLDG